MQGAIRLHLVAIAMARSRGEVGHSQKGISFLSMTKGWVVGEIEHLQHNTTQLKMHSFFLERSPCKAVLEWGEFKVQNRPWMLLRTSMNFY
jgi:hypothetical protein